MSIVKHSKKDTKMDTNEMVMVMRMEYELAENWKIIEELRTIQGRPTVEEDEAESYDKMLEDC
jgi:hypothetical protein